MKKSLLLWSGGVCSTSVLWDLTQEGHSIDLLTIDEYNNSHRNYILSVLDFDYPCYQIDSKIGIDGISTQDEDGYLKMLLMIFGNTDILSYDEVYFGHCKGQSIHDRYVNTVFLKTRDMMLHLLKPNEYTKIPKTPLFMFPNYNQTRNDLINKMVNTKIGDLWSTRIQVSNRIGRV